MSIATVPYSAAGAPLTSWWYCGCLVTSLATAAATAGRVSAVEVTMRQGMEPPPHIHAHEDEAYYVLDGRFTFRIREETVDAPPGTWVWLPREVIHTFQVDGDGARALVFSFPGGFLEKMFEPFSEPAKRLELPPMPEQLPFDEMLALDASLGVRYPEGPGVEPTTSAG
jgi:quercetin dioxygenase-like cupin family protein